MRRPGRNPVARRDPQSRSARLPAPRREAATGSGPVPAEEEGRAAALQDESILVAGETVRGLPRPSRPQSLGGQQEAGPAPIDIAGPSYIAPSVSGVGRHMSYSAAPTASMEGVIPGRAGNLLDAGPSTARPTAPGQLGEQAIAIMGPTLQGFTGHRLGTQEDLGRGLADLVGGLEDWVRNIRQGQLGPPQTGPSPLAGSSPAAALGCTVSAPSSVVSNKSSSQPRAGEGEKEVDVCERIWKGEYVDIFSLLPLERFNLDRARRDEKKEEDEKRRYRLISHSFSNWLQAFAILASVIGEKAPDNCLALFCYLDAIGDGGVSSVRGTSVVKVRQTVPSTKGGSS